MCETLAQHMADEWWFKIRERFYTCKDKPVNGMTAAFIEDDVLKGGTGVDARRAGDAARGACEILKERVRLEANDVMADGIEAWLFDQGVTPLELYQTVPFTSYHRLREGLR
jgi:hypothetical protein